MLDYKATTGVFVGYCLTSKHYKIYDPDSHWLVTTGSPVVIFYEDHRYWKSVVAISSKQSADREIKHVEQYGFEKLFGNSLEAYEENEVTVAGGE